MADLVGADVIADILGMTPDEIAQAIAMANRVVNSGPRSGMPPSDSVILMAKALLLFSDKEKCARAYAEAFIRKNPKYQPLVKGKTWPEVFKVLGIKV